MSDEKSEKFASSEFLRSIRDQDEISDSNIPLRIIDPLLEELGWPIRKPNEEFSVETDYKMYDESFDYALINSSEPKVLFELNNELRVDKRKKKILNKVDMTVLVVTDGYQYRIFIRADNDVHEVYNFKIQNINTTGPSVKIISLDGVDSGLTDKSIQTFRNIRRDIEYIKNNKENLSKMMSETVSNNTNSVPEDISLNGANRMMNFINRRLDGMNFNEVVRMTEDDKNISGVSLDKLGDGRVIVVSDTREGIKKRINREKSIGELVTDVDEDPDYLAFYIEEDQSIQYISDVKSFKLKHEKSQDQFANKVYNVELSRIKDISDPVPDNSGVFENIEYVTIKDLAGCESLDEITKPST